jgi:prophage antirepressor-like protein
MTALISLKSCFEDRTLTTLELDGRPCWIAREVGRTLGYEQEGLRFVTQITGRWADELIEGVDYRIVRGEELKAIKELLGTFDDTGSVSSNCVHDPGSVSTKAGVAPELDTPERFDDTGSVPSRVNRQLLVLFESGLHIACLKTTKPLGRKLRRFLATEVLPQLARTGEYRRPRHVTELDLAEREVLGQRMLDLLDTAVERGLMERADAQRRWQQSMRLYFDEAMLAAPVGPHLQFSGKPLYFEWALYELGPEYGFHGSATRLAPQYEAFVMRRFPPDVVGGASLRMETNHFLEGPRRKVKWAYPESLHRLLLPEFLQFLKAGDGAEDMPSLAGCNMDESELS